MKVGDRVRIEHPLEVWVHLHNQDGFRATLLALGPTLMDAYAYFTKDAPEFILREGLLGQEGKIVAIIAGPTWPRAINVLQTAGTYRFLLVTKEGLQSLEKDPLVGYVRDSDGFLTNPDNWKGGLKLV